VRAIAKRDVAGDGGPWRWISGRPRATSPIRRPTYQTASGGVFQSWQVSLTPGATPVALGPPALNGIVRVPSPDGTSVLLVTGDPGTVTRVDTANGSLTSLSAGSDVHWQREARAD